MSSFAFLHLGFHFSGNMLEFAKFTGTVGLIFTISIKRSLVAESISRGKSYVPFRTASAVGDVAVYPNWLRKFLRQIGASSAR